MRDYFIDDLPETAENMPEVMLWQSVIMQAILDATGNISSGLGIHEKAASLSWLKGRSSDFLMVCDMAGMIPDYVSRLYFAARLAKVTGREKEIQTVKHRRNVAAKKREKR